jgi:lysophospholipase L1-like esterase
MEYNLHRLRGLWMKVLIGIVSLFISLILVEQASKFYWLIDKIYIVQNRCCGHTFIKNLKDVETWGYMGDYRTILSTNLHGFLDDRPWEPGESKKRIGVFGDSFVAGRQVAPNKRFPQLLSGHFDLDVINFGVDGYGIVNSIMVLDKFAKKASLSGAVLFISFNDIYEDSLYLDKYPAAIQRELITPDNAPLGLLPLDLLNPIVVEIFNNLNLARISYYSFLFQEKVRRRNSVLERSLIDPSILENEFKVVRLFMKRAKALGLSRGVVILPLHTRWLPFIDAKKRNAYFQFFTSQLQKDNIPYLSLNWSDGLIKQNVLPYDMHFNEQGHQKVAKLMTDWIDRIEIGQKRANF